MIMRFFASLRMTYEYICQIYGNQKNVPFFEDPYYENPQNSHTRFGEPLPSLRSGMTEQVKEACVF